jgi:multidrug efflux pump subunit AcrB
VPLVSKVELFGVQDEKINIEFSHKKFAQLGIPFEAIVNQIATRMRWKPPACWSRRPITCRCA